jgi:uncharacterized protein YidB (DUF937 family)
MKERPKTAAEFDERFDDGEDMGQWIDWERSYRPNEAQRIDVVLPHAVVAQLDDVATREGVSRSTLLQRLISQSLPKAA